MERAIKDIKRNKVTGQDNIPVALLKEMGENGLWKLTKFINRMYETGEWPEDVPDW